MAGSKAVLVLNTGSSSIKYALYNLGKTTTCVFKGLVDGIGTSKSSITHKNIQAVQDVRLQGLDMTDHKVGLQKAVEIMRLGEGHSTNVCAVGHRVVHGGEALTQPSIITSEVKNAIHKASSLAPLHNPPSLQGIKVAEELFGCPQVAVFDTAFHSTLPPHAYMYALPYSLYEEIRIRRYGFHGTSYKYLLERSSEVLNKPKKDLNIIFFHLGAGASMAVVKQGACIDTTMGITPLEGLVMATRSGDVDPAVSEILAAEKKMDVGAVTKMLNNESGLYGLCGDKDMGAIIQAVDAGSEKHQLALKVFTHRIRKYLGAYLVQLEGNLDALVFSAGIGESSGRVRGLICEGLENFGIELDEQENKDGKIGAKEIQKKGSRIKVLVIPTDEELSIAQQTLGVVDSLRTSPVMPS